jgi:hypothetical protein
VIILTIERAMDHVVVTERPQFDREEEIQILIGLSG